MAVLLAVCCCLSAVSGLPPETGRSIAALSPGFDPEHIVQQVQSDWSGSRVLTPSDASLEDGEFLIDTSRTPVPASGCYPAIAFDGENFLAVWRLGQDIYATRVTPAGVVLDPAGILVSTTASEWSPDVALAFAGTNFLVVWSEDRTGDTGDIYGARVTPTGAVLDPSGIPISTAVSFQLSPAIASDGANFLVMWEDARSASRPDIYGARVTPAGAVLDPAGIPISVDAGLQISPALAFDGENFLAVWQDGLDASADIQGARVTPAGVVLDPTGIAISLAANEQCCPAIGFGGADFLVTWADGRSGSHDIYGARVTPGGAVLDTSGIAVSAAAYSQCEPSLTFDDTNFLVVWEDSSFGVSFGIHGARVTPGGAVLDSAGIVISNTAHHLGYPVLASDGTQFLVTWGESRGLPFPWLSPYIYGARVTPAGAVLDPSGVPISTAVSGQWSPALAFGGTNFLAAWSSGGTGDLCGARVTPAGVVLDTTCITISSAPGNQESPALAFGGEDFLVAWNDRRSGTDCDVYGARVTSAGLVLDTSGIGIATAAGTQWDPALAFGRTDFLVAWGDYQQSYSDIYGARVTPAGAVLDPTGIPISIATGYQEHPAAASDSDNTLVVWQDDRSGSCDIYGARVTPQGTVLDSAGFVISQAAGRQEYPALGFDGTNSLVVWQDEREDSLGDIYGARVTPAGIVLDPLGIAISTTDAPEGYPVLAFEGEDFLVVWQESGTDSQFDIDGARVAPDGAVFDRGTVVSQERSQTCPALAPGTGNQMLLVYQGWAGSVGGKTYNTNRIWGKLDPNPAIADMTKPEARRTSSGATIVRGVLSLPSASSVGRRASCILLDITGRKVLDLQPGANDVRALAPGVYLVRGEGRGTGGEGRIRKVVVTR